MKPAKLPPRVSDEPLSGVLLQRWFEDATRGLEELPQFTVPWPAQTLRDPLKWTPERQAFLELLERGPARAPREPRQMGTDCKRWGWVDWVRDTRGRPAYGDLRFVLTEAGAKTLAAWRREGYRA
jgi:hypothetical protein